MDDILNRIKDYPQNKIGYLYGGAISPIDQSITQRERNEYTYIEQQYNCI